MMRRRIVRGALALLFAALGFVAWVYAASEAHLRSFGPPPAFAQPIPSDAAALARGDHIAAYDEAAFRRLMREGVALGERELELMSPVARGRFAWFTDQEVADVYAFLTDMSRRAAEAQ